jgi:hypothetical protein
MMRVNPPLSLLGLGFLVGVVALIQNHAFYAVHGPFYDSMSYLNQLAWVMRLTREQGVLAAIRDSSTGSTVFLPWLFGALLAIFTEPSRALGVVIQLPLLFLQMATGYRYFRVVTGTAQGKSVLYTLTLVSFPAVFFFNGGLCDFRMDLSQAYAFGAFLAALMVARLSGSLWEWAFVGTVLAVACLVRATTPVYAVLVLGVTFLFDLRKRGWLFPIRRYLLMGAVAVLLSGWFYIGNFEYLHYYYFIWNPDANASLPLQKSLMHVAILANHIGWSLGLALACVALTSIPSLARPNEWRTFSPNWVALVGSLVPISYLVLSGAGLNPFVSMVGVPGLILFMLHPGEQTGRDNKKGSFNKRFVPFVLAFGLAVSLTTSFKNFDKKVSNWIPYRSGIAELVDAIGSDARLKGIDQPRMAFLYQGSVDAATITNHLIYEQGYRFRKDHGLEANGVNIETRPYGFGAEADWKNIPGNTDQSKLDYLLQDAYSNTDYIVMADETSNLPLHHRVNRYAAYVRAGLSDKNLFERVKSGIVLSNTENVSLYRTIKPE